VRLLAGALLGAVAISAAAAPTPIVRVAISPETVAVGEPARLRVTVLVPTWFREAPRFPSFELANAIVRLPPDASRPTSARIGGDNWSGIVRDYQLYPLLGASYRMPAQTLRVTYADPDTTGPVSVDVEVPGFELRGEVPVGAAGLDPYLAGSALRLERAIEGDTTALVEGGALVVRYVAELRGLSALFLPPLTAALQLDGVSIYADQPVVEDGEPARRSEQLTLVFRRGGEFTLPGLALDWWNTATGEIETATLAPLTLSVQGRVPSLQERMAVLQPGWRAIALVLMGLALLAWLWRRWAPALLRALLERRQAYRRSERCAFRALRTAIAGGDERAAHHALLRWLQRLDPATDARRFARAYGDAQLQRDIDQLSAALYRGAAQPVDLARLSRGLGRARRAFSERRSAQRRASLPPLNP